MTLATFLTTLTPLACWQHECTQTFWTFTELSNHHLAAHERPILTVSPSVWDAITLPKAYTPPNWKRHEQPALTLNGQRSTL